MKKMANKKNSIIFMLLSLFTCICVAKDCFKDRHCPHLQGCCSDGKCSSNCFRKYCAFTADCNSGFRCKYGICTSVICSYDSDCSAGKSCCYDRKCSSSCVGKLCISNSHCASGECCDIHFKCISDCGNIAGWIIVVIVISIIMVIAILVGITILCCCATKTSSTRSVQTGMIVTEPTTEGTTVIANNQQQHLPQLPLKPIGPPPMYFPETQECSKEPPPYEPNEHFNQPAVSGIPSQSQGNFQ
ncbi:cysteine and tyrosine-rich protein 1-like [Xenia sp. Carnegie-2017]|uniref:cysteine and tyrosine-rich protein 1-like n=1 Tax=Xenia sp. Carnegie-2017 TaxID=2897299 RepID=UPI001F04B4C5|nr:cysteine and tyrosine-rich protein 1-like [Xenia sp. Carnegie-2017]